MAYRFRLHGKGLQHSWEKDCRPEAALAHANQVAREYAKDDLYHGTAIRVVDNAGNEVATVPVPDQSG